METVTHGGTVFTKATVLAKKYRYTTDYIGQLCRGGKVESKLIGRAWFVNEESLLQHKSDRYASVRTPEIIINKSVFSEKSETKIVPRILPTLSKNTHRNLQKETHLVVHHEQTSPRKRATYHTDSGELEPVTFLKLSKSEPVTPVVKPEPSKNIPISLGEKAKHTLTFEPLPEVSLQGNLAVQSLDDPDLFIDTEPVSVSDISFTPKTIIDAPVIRPVRPVTRPKLASVPIKHAMKHAAVSTPSKPLPTSDFKKSITVEKVKTSEPISRVSFLAVPGFVLGAIFLCVGILSLSSYVEWDGMQTRESLKFNLAAVGEVVEKLPSSY